MYNFWEAFCPLPFWAVFSCWTSCWRERFTAKKFTVLWVSATFVHQLLTDQLWRWVFSAFDCSQTELLHFNLLDSLRLACVARLIISLMCVCVCVVWKRGWTRFWIFITASFQENFYENVCKSWKLTGNWCVVVIMTSVFIYNYTSVHILFAFAWSHRVHTLMIIYCTPDLCCVYLMCR